MITITDTCANTGRKATYTVNDWSDGKAGRCGHCHRSTRIVKPFKLISPPGVQSLCKVCAVATVPNYDGKD